MCLRLVLVATRAREWRACLQMLRASPRRRALWPATNTPAAAWLLSRVPVHARRFRMPLPACRSANSTCSSWTDEVDEPPAGARGSVAIEARELRQISSFCQVSVRSRRAVPGIHSSGTTEISLRETQHCYSFRQSSWLQFWFSFSRNKIALVLPRFTNNLALYSAAESDCASTWEFVGAELPRWLDVPRLSKKISLVPPSPTAIEWF